MTEFYTVKFGGQPFFLSKMMEKRRVNKFMSDKSYAKIWIEEIDAELTNIIKEISEKEEQVRYLDFKLKVLVKFNDYRFNNIRTEISDKISITAKEVVKLKEKKSILDIAKAKLIDEFS